MPIYEAEVELKSTMFLTINRDGKNLPDFLDKLFSKYTSPGSAGVIRKINIKCPKLLGTWSVLGVQKVGESK